MNSPNSLTDTFSPIPACPPPAIAPYLLAKGILTPLFDVFSFHHPHISHIPLTRHHCAPFNPLPPPHRPQEKNRTLFKKPQQCFPPSVSPLFFPVPLWPSLYDHMMTLSPPHSPPFSHFFSFYLLDLYSTPLPSHILFLMSIPCEDLRVLFPSMK